jgi:hypothetical protein
MVFRSGLLAHTAVLDGIGSARWPFTRNLTSVWTDEFSAGIVRLALTDALGFCWRCSRHQPSLHHCCERSHLCHRVASEIDWRKPGKPVHLLLLMLSGLISGRWWLPPSPTHFSMSCRRFARGHQDVVIDGFREHHFVPMPTHHPCTSLPPFGMASVTCGTRKWSRGIPTDGTVRLLTFLAHYIPP